MVNLLSDDEKENGAALLRKKKTPVQDDEPVRLLEELLVLPELNTRIEVPTTPAGKLAFMDLMSMGDARESGHEVSPEERIQWDHNKDMIHSSASSFHGARRARKRARSSSPAASSPAQTSGHFRKRTGLPETPIDPGSDLWGRLSHTASTVPTPQGQLMPAFANMMYSSSPQPQNEGTTPRAIAGFKRANSCGNQFPKRRRVGTKTDGDVFTGVNNIGPSKLSVLIEKVQEGLTQPLQSASPDVSSKSSTPSKRLYENMETESQPQEELLQDPPQIRSRVREQSPREPIRRAAPPPALAPCSSDYGDDDIDESLLEALDDSRAGSILEPVREVDSLDQPRRTSRSSTIEPEPNSQLAVTGKNESFESNTMKDDEFDDSDVDMFAADLEMLASKYDWPAAPQADQSLPEPVAPEVLKAPRLRTLHVPDSDDSDDEFGIDGLDESDLVAAEVTATQSIQQSANGLLPVRTRFS